MAPAGHHAHTTTAAVDLVAFLTLGLLGGFGHCAGMCSPFVLFVSRRHVPRSGGRGTVVAAQAWYTAGRVVTYAVLGRVAGALGGAVELAGALVGLQRAAAIVAGAVLVAWALVALSDLSRFEIGGHAFARIAGAAKGRVPGHPFATGLFLGLLPCGLLYSAVIAAVARGGALQGAAALALFGLGTAPALLGISLADELLASARAIEPPLAVVHPRDGRLVPVAGASLRGRNMLRPYGRHAAARPSTDIIGARGSGGQCSRVHVRFARHRAESIRGSRAARRVRARAAVG
jgi:uncharacterized protein